MAQEPIKSLMSRFYLIVILLFFFLFTSSRVVGAESPYVLPYPSAMPGSIFYKLNLLQEEILKYWYFGDFGQFEYNLKQSDKYLVEAKILFDYKQYLLAGKALKKSDSYFALVKPSLVKALSDGKKINEKKILLAQAAQKHIEEIVKLEKIIPSSFEWRPEKENSQTLNLLEMLENSKKIREQNL